MGVASGPMSDIARITDVSPRDGLQNESALVPTDDKVRLIRMLAHTGVDEVEATSFVSPKWVPQLGDAEQVLEALRTTPLLPRPVLSVLAPNEKGFERALAIHSPEFPLKLALFTAASETFNQKNTNATIAQSIERFRPILPRAIAAGMDVRLYVSCVIACPFEGPIKPSAVRSVVDQLLDLVDDQDAQLNLDIDLGDTIGVAHPQEINALIDAFDEALIPQITLHLHDTFGRASACVRTALDRGIMSYDGSVAGLGGCPYAGTPERRAPGNISTDLLVRTIEQAGIETRVNLDALNEAAAFARSITGRV